MFATVRIVLQTVLVWPLLRKTRPVIDLAYSKEVTTALLSTTDWRSRVVEQVDLEKALSCRNRRSLQLAPLREALINFLPKGCIEQVTISLPVATLPKRPLVNFSLQVATGEAYLLKRREIAEREAHYLASLSAGLGVELSGQAEQFITAICEFTPGPWKRYRSGGVNANENEELRSYLTEGLKIPICQQTLNSWKGIADEIGSIIDIAFDEGYDPESPADNPLLALPLLFSRDNPAAPQQIDQLLSELASFVHKCIDVDGPRAAPLEVLGDYGRRYEAIVACTVPVDEPTVVHMTQDMPLKVDLRGLVELETVFNDAATNHIAVRVLDPDVEVVRLAAHDVSGNELSDDSFTSVRDSSEDFAVYGSESDRQYRIKLRFRLKPSWWTTTVSVSVFVTTTIAVVLALTVRPLTSSDVALLVVPTTFASGLLLVQQRTTLAISSQVLLRVGTVFILLALWCTIAVEYWAGVVTQI